MADSLIFYTNPQSRGRIVRWMLEETGAEYRTEVLEYGTTIKAPEYLRINPMGKVPTVVHNGRVITECAAICAYLADVFAPAGLAPAIADRSDYYRWLFFAAGPLEAALTNHALGLNAPAEKAAMLGYGSYDAAVTTLEKAVAEKPFITGDKFTAADVYVGSHVGFGLQFGSLEKRAAFEDYFARVSDRDAHRRAQEKDNALLPK